LLNTAAAMQGDRVAAAEALLILLRMRPEFSLTWVSDTTPLVGDVF
jgi:hypothetical protein